MVNHFSMMGAIPDVPTKKTEATITIPVAAPKLPPTKTKAASNATAVAVNEDSSTMSSVSPVGASSGDPGFEIDQNMYVMAMNMDILSLRDLLIGDKILTINGNKPKNNKEALECLKPGTSEFQVKLEVMRRQHAVPLTVERQKKAGLVTQPGFSYCIVNCFREKNSKPFLGITLSWERNRAYVTATETGSAAAQFFAPGDGFVDIDGMKIPTKCGSNPDPSFLKIVGCKYQTEGKLSVIIERAVSPSMIRLVKNFIRSSCMADDDDEPIGPDAILIGNEAARMHRMVFAKVEPKSVLNQNRVKRGKGISVSNKLLESTVASDVDDEENLKAVERKSHAQNNLADSF